MGDYYTHEELQEVVKELTQFAGWVTQYLNEASTAIQTIADQLVMAGVFDVHYEAITKGPNG